MNEKPSSSNNSENSEFADSEDTVDASFERLEDDTDSYAETSENDAPELIEGEVIEDLSLSEENTERDDIEEEFSDPTNSVPATVVETSTKSGWSAMLGGLAAGIIGFLAATFFGPNATSGTDPQDSLQVTDQLEAMSEQLAALEASQTELPESAPDPRVDELSAQLLGFEEQLQAIGSAAAVAAAAPAVAPADNSGMEEFSQRIEEIQSDVAEDLSLLEDRITGIEEWQTSALDGVLRTDDLTDDQLVSFQSELERMTASAREEVEAAQERASEFEILAAEAAETAEREKAFAELTAAMESGESFDEPLSLFDAAPDPLVSSASDGVPTLAELQRSFPAAARNALSVVQTVPQDASAGQRFTAFLKRQTNARSLAPRDGNDADAVMSRVEAELNNGMLEAALGELTSLPEEARDALSDWSAKAELRLAALDALSKLKTED